MSTGRRGLTTRGWCAVSRCFFPKASSSWPIWPRRWTKGGERTSTGRKLRGWMPPSNGSSGPSPPAAIAIPAAERTEPPSFSNSPTSLRSSSATVKASGGNASSKISSITPISRRSPPLTCASTSTKSCAGRGGTVRYWRGFCHTGAECWTRAQPASGSSTAPTSMAHSI